SQPTLSLTPTTGGQGGDRQLNLSGSGGGDDAPPPPDDGLPALWKKILRIWRMMQQAGTTNNDRPNQQSETNLKPTTPGTESVLSPISDFWDSENGLLPLDPATELFEAIWVPEKILFSSPSEDLIPSPTLAVSQTDPNRGSPIPTWAWVALLPAL